MMIKKDSLQMKGIGMTSQRTRNRLKQRLQEQGISNHQVLEAIASVPRHIFIDEALADRAYEDLALPIGFDQTISQPYIVARMCEIIMQVQPKNVLEIGTGCGYQAIVLRQLIDKVYSIERIEGLYKKARRHIHDLRENIYLRHGDGFVGLPNYAPFDAIVMAAAPADVPMALLEQLADGGVLIAPLGEGKEQMLVQFTRQGTQIIREQLEPAYFVPFKRGVE